MSNLYSNQNYCEPQVNRYYSQEEHYINVGNEPYNNQLQYSNIYSQNNNILPSVQVSVDNTLNNYAQPNDIFETSFNNLSIKRDLSQQNTHFSHSFQSLSIQNNVSSGDTISKSSQANSSISLPQKLENKKVQRRKEENISSTHLFYNKETPTKSMRKSVNIMNERIIIPPSGICHPDPKDFLMTKITKEQELIRCTFTALPSTEEMLLKSCLPLGLIIHPFRNLTNLQVIKNKRIIRCHDLSCRAYLNPYVTFMSKQRWKCNICLRMNEFSEQDTNMIICEADKQNSYSIQNYKQRPEIRYATIEYIASKESAHTNKAPLYIFLFDLSIIAVKKLKIGTMDSILRLIVAKLDQIAGYNIAKVSFIGYDKYIHLYQLNNHGYQELLLMDMEEIKSVELPVNTGLINSLIENRESVKELLQHIAYENFTNITDESQLQTDNCLGSAILIGKKLAEISHCPARFTIFNSSSPTVGEGVISKTCNTLSPSIDFYKTLSLELAQKQIGVDMFQLGKIDYDIASLSLLTRYCGGSWLYYPELTTSPTNLNLKQNVDSQLELDRLLHDLKRYLNRKIGFDAVLRVRYSPGLTVKMSYGNMFVRAYDLYALANVSPDNAIGVQLGIEESGLGSVVYIQTALLYISISGERRIRVHTFCLPVSNRLEDVYRLVDAETVAVLLAKAVAEKLTTNNDIRSSKKALIDSVLESVTGFSRSCLSGSYRLSGITLPYYMRLLPLLIWSLTRWIKMKDTSSVEHMASLVYNCNIWRMGTIFDVMAWIYPGLYRLDSVITEDSIQIQPSFELDDVGAFSNRTTTNISSSSSGSYSYDDDDDDDNDHHDDEDVHFTNESSETEFILGWKPARLHLTKQSLAPDGVYLLDFNKMLLMLIGHGTSPAFLKQIFGVNELSDLMRTDGYYITNLPECDNIASIRLRSFICELQCDRPLGSPLVVFVPPFNMTHPGSILTLHVNNNLLEDESADQGSYLRFLTYVQKHLMNS